MNLIINGKEEIIEHNGTLSVTELLKIKNVKLPDMVSVELNDEFVKRENFSSTNITVGDKIEFLYFMGGGK